MDPIETATHQWAANKLKERDIKFQEVTNVEFTTIQGGYCETCEYTTTGIEIGYRDLRGRSGSIELEKYLGGETDIATIVREISALVEHPYGPGGVLPPSEH